MCKCLYRIFLKVSILTWTKKDQEKALNNGSMAVEILLLMKVFANRNKEQLITIIYKKSAYCFRNNFFLVQLITYIEEKHLWYVIFI